MQTIIVAAGFEIRDFQGSVLTDFLNAQADAGSGSVWTFPKGVGAGAVTHQVQMVFTMAEFAAALEMDDAYVIYEGHSRYGQGPAFGPPRPSGADMPWVPDTANFPINPWGVHFRMGYDATDTDCMEDLLEHSVTPAEYDVPASAAGAFIPGAVKRAVTNAKKVKKAKVAAGRVCSTAGAWRLFNDCDATVAATATSRGDTPLDGRHYYAAFPRKRPRKIPPGEYLTAVQVGSADLDKSALKCKVLFMASCSSHVHYFRPLARRRTAVKSKCKFYMTAMICSAFHGRNFMAEVFKGTDPTTKRGSKAMLKALNGVSDSGSVGFY
jgi:hypothetical protein